MFSKLLYTLSVILLAAMCVLSNQTSKEGWIMYDLGVKVEREFCEKDKNGNIVNCVQYPNYHAMRNIKFSPLGLGSAVYHNTKNTNLVDVGLVSHARVTNQDLPVTLNKETGVCEKSGQCTTSSCNVSLENFREGQDPDLQDSVIESEKANNVTNPHVKDQMHQMFDKKQERDLIVRDRLIYANGNSRNQSQGDPIRGDLPIIYNEPGLYTPHQARNPTKNLRAGALSVMGDSKAISQLIHEASMGSVNTIAGVDVSRDESIAKDLRTSSIQVDTIYNGRAGEEIINTGHPNHN